MRDVLLFSVGGDQARRVDRVKKSAAVRLFNYQRAIESGRISAIRIDSKPAARSVITAVCVCARSRAIFLSRETIYRQRNRRRSGGASAIPRRDTPKPKSRRYRTVDADYWPMIPILRWHLRAVITIPPCSIGRDDRDAADLVSLSAFVYRASRPAISRVNR